jgi:O-antigen ligase/polysaccharide polymerase Wzy-like membrane protein
MLLASTAPKLLAPWADRKILAGFAIATTVGVLVAAYPLPALGGLAVCASLYLTVCWCRGRMEFWQGLVLLSLAPYMILNFGFDNFAINYVPVGDLLLLVALAIVVRETKREVWRKTLADPPVVCLIALLLLSCCHLIVDVPRYGLYAVRDSSMFFEAAFIVLGILWPKNPRSTQLLVRFLFLVLLVNLVYAYTFSWSERIQAMSPNFGVFHPVPLFGNYQEARWLLLGAPFFVWFGPSVVRWPRWFLMVLAAAQLGGLAIMQDRSMYVGIVVILLILLLFRQTKKLLAFLSTIGWGIAVLLVLTAGLSALGVKLQGRMGPVDASFIEEHAKTMLSIGTTNALASHEVDRADWYGQVWGRITSSPVNLVVGEGFGQALIHFENEQGIPVRQPHNSSLTVLARLGFVGLLFWLLFIALFVVRCVRFLRAPYASAVAFALVLWLFVQTIVVLMESSVQPLFEFSHGAIPFYFLVGLAIGLMRNGKGHLDFRPLGRGVPRSVAL